MSWRGRAQVCWSVRMDSVGLARRFGLGRPVKISLNMSDEECVDAATSFQEAAYAGGVPTPQVRRTTDGQVFATIAGKQLRVYEWVDLLAPDSMLDPARVGEV